LHMQLARNPQGAKSTPDPLTRIRIGAQHAQPCSSAKTAEAPQ